MNISNHGLQLLKSFEGCRLTAYWDIKGYSIGYGHFGVAKDTVITQAQADAYLREDIAKYENAVNSLGYDLTQGQFDALVDFAYNCGIGNLKSITNNGRRTLDVVASKLPLYNKAGGVVLKGLVNRRAAEVELFNNKTIASDNIYYPAYKESGNSIVNALKFLGIDSTKAHRIKIAQVNNISNYEGTAEQNLQMLNLLKAGKLKRV